MIRKNMRHAFGVAAMCGAALLAGCDVHTVQQADAKKYAGSIDATDTKYARDERADLCYSYSVDESLDVKKLDYRESVSFSNVACSDAVVSLAQKRSAEDAAFFNPALLVYRQDNRTSQCFAYAVYETVGVHIGVGKNDKNEEDLTATETKGPATTIVAAVPCSPKVMALVSK